MSASHDSGVGAPDPGRFFADPDTARRFLCGVAGYWTCWGVAAVFLLIHWRWVALLFAVVGCGSLLVALTSLRVGRLGLRDRWAVWSQLSEATRVAGWDRRIAPALIAVLMVDAVVLVAAWVQRVAAK